MLNVDRGPSPSLRLTARRGFEHPQPRTSRPLASTLIADALYNGHSLSDLRERITDESVDLVYLDRRSTRTGPLSRQQRRGHPSFELMEMCGCGGGRRTGQPPWLART
jgi:hypothetical protein